MKFIILATVTFMVVGGQMMAPNNLNPKQTLIQPELENNGRAEIDPSILNHPLVQVANPMNSPMNIQQQYPANYLLTVLQYPVYATAPMVPQTQDVTPMVTPMFTPMITHQTQEQDTNPQREPRRRYQNNSLRYNHYWTTSGHRCKYPFAYKRKWYYQCTYTDHHVRWCATSTYSNGYVKSSGNCYRG